jgi:hypothetical protein
LSFVTEFGYPDIQESPVTYEVIMNARCSAMRLYWTHLVD